MAYQALYRTYRPRDFEEVAESDADADRVRYCCEACGMIVDF